MRDYPERLAVDLPPEVEHLSEGDPPHHNLYVERGRVGSQSGVAGGLHGLLKVGGGASGDAAHCHDLRRKT